MRCCPAACTGFYEALIEDTETQVRRLLEHCGLPFEEACLQFYENDRAVRTASSEQVRQPIFREGVDHWRHYEPWLGPLKRPGRGARTLSGRAEVSIADRFVRYIDQFI